MYERYEQMLYQNTALDFDDLLFKVNTLFEQIPKVAEKYQDKYVHFMVDEFQDTNIAQYNIAKQISEQYRNICVVGDPDQSIYSWRNADIRNILSFQSDFPEAKIVTLEQNYRSTQTILSAASNLITSNEQRVEKELWTKNGEGVPVVVTEAYDDREEAQFVIRELNRLVQQDDYDRGDIAVMYRVNDQSRAFEESCMRYGIPYQLVGSLRFYQRQEIKDLIAYLRLIANPNDDVSFARVVNLPSRGIGQRTMYELSRLARELGMSMFEAIEEIPANDQLVQIQARSIRALTNFRDLVNGLFIEKNNHDLITLVDHILEETGYRDYVSQGAERSEERLENIEEFRSSATEFSGLESSEALIAFLERVSLASDTDTLEDKKDEITLITLHQAKGLEFPVVFIVGMEEGLLPHERSMNDKSEMEEERRLAYVGVTRAKERLYLTRAFRRGFRGGYGPNEPSRFLADIPEELIDITASDQTAGLGIQFDPDGNVQDIKRSNNVGTKVISKTRLAGETDTPSLKKTEDPSLPTLTTGDKVRHSKFGEGIVTGTKPSGIDIEITVAFSENQGIKRLLHSFARLEKIE